ncbi:MAG: serine hydrolase domain-containing protein [Myxococcota bacterium]
MATARRTLVLGSLLVLLALALGVVFGPTAFRVLQALRHHGPERARHELSRFEPPWQGPLVAYETATPDEQGLSESQLAAWTARLADHRTQHLLVVAGGKLAWEWRAPGRRANDMVHVSALTKGSAGTAAMAVAIDDGHVRLDDPASRWIPAWRDDPQRAGITLRMLMDHTSGVQNVVYGGDGAGLVGWEKEFSDHHERRFPLTLTRAPLRFAPGSRVEYTSLAYYALSYALTAALRDSDTPDLVTLLRERVHGPLGIPDAAFEMSYGRHEELDGLRLYTVASGAAYTPRALARVGELFLSGSRRGVRIARWRTLEDLLTPKDVPADRPADEPPPACGWWSNRDRFFPSLPRDAVLAAGSNHRILLVVPSLDLVVVRLGSWLEPADARGGYWDGVDALLFAPLVAAVRG